MVATIYLGGALLVICTLLARRAYLKIPLTLEVAWGIILLAAFWPLVLVLIVVGGLTGVEVDK